MTVLKFWITPSWILISLCANNVLLDTAWNNKVYTGRHFNSLIVNSTNINNDIDDTIVTTPAVLVMYDESCLARMKAESIDDSSIPPPKLLAFAKYNYREVEDSTWYNLDEEDDLRERYGYLECPDVIYLPKGGTVDRPVPWVQGEPFLNWIWGPFRKKVEIKNDLLEVIEIDIHGSGPKLQKVYVDPGVYKTFYVYISYTFMVKKLNSEKLLMYYVVENSVDNLDFTVNDMSIKKFASMSEQKWLDKVNSKISNENDAVSNHRKKLATMFALGLKQPLVIPKFTDSGYNKTANIDEKLFQDLREYYRNHQQNFAFVNLEPRFNTDDAKIRFIKLDQEVEQTIVKYLQPTLEEWSSCKLTLTEISGLYVLSHGSFIRPHTGNAKIHAISVLLMLDTDEDGWKLELLDYSGNRIVVPFVSGNSLLYESATIMHNSRTSFKGNACVLLYVHFKPVHRWNWSVNEDVITDGVIKENIYQLETEITKKQTRKQNIHSKFIQDIHDEL